MLNEDMDPLFAVKAALSERDWDRVNADEAAAAAFFQTQRFHTVLDRIGELLRRSVTRKLPSGELDRSNRLKGRAVMIVGESGAGKTRTVERAVLTNPSLRPSDGAHPTRPLLSINAPESPSPRSLYMRLLNGTGYPLVSAPSTEIVLQRVKAQARKLGVVLLHIDDADNMIVGQDSFRRRRAAERIAACLRGFMEDDNPISLIISGREPILDLMRHDDAFARRARVLRSDPVQPGENASLAKAIRARAAEMGIQFDPTQELIERLVHAARGQLGLALELSWQALAVARERNEQNDGMGQLEVDDYAIIYHRRTGCAPGFNVFDAADWRRIDTGETLPKLRDDTVTAGAPSRRRA